ncbi:MAG: fluoride efflux transporter CrcB [Xanthomonadaceae bacterium]|jgi:CrcB protein|nr:fluoride efflux transporter CrcB [Xanthomonadaceae bacterium]
MFRLMLVIGAGAAIGAWGRWGLSEWLNPMHSIIPLGTLCANVFGGLCVGLALGWLNQHPEWGPEWRLFIVTGMLGAFTTFSTFSSEVVHMLEQQNYGWAFGTTLLHLIGSLSMTVLGLAISRWASSA